MAGKAYLRYELPTAPKWLNNFFAVGLILQLIIVLFAGLFTTWPTTGLAASSAFRPGTNHNQDDFDVTQYQYLMDSMVMILMGWAFLFCLIPKYGWAGISVALLCFCVAFEWNIVIRGWIRDENFTGALSSIVINIDTLAHSIFCCAAVLIAVGSVLGRTSLEQMSILAFFGTPAYNFNAWLCADKIGATDPGGSFIVHCFGAFMGVGASWVLGHDEGHKLKRRFTEEGNYHTNIFAMIGTIFLWIYYPSINSYIVKDGLAKYRASSNTLIALLFSASVSIILSDFSENVKKNMMIHLQAATLAGGIGIGALADHPIEPWGAALIGVVNAVICCLAIYYVTPWMENTLKIHDTCDCMALHGICAFFAVFASCISLAVADEDSVYGQMYKDNQAGKQLAGVFISAGLGLVFGVLIGFVMGMFSRDDHWYDANVHFKKVD